MKMTKLAREAEVAGRLNQLESLAKRMQEDPDLFGSGSIQDMGESLLRILNELRSLVGKGIEK